MEEICLMENKGFRETETGTELNKVTITGEINSIATCTPEVCRRTRQEFQPPNLINHSPWNQKKTYFFIGIICLMVIWIIAYTIVSKLKLV
ncbi:uncharacterized protein [Euwallacea fornicatus]|uniref:uncharacterized protein isoform X2 n=1 Tax=Euwallacea fornicatus TaxID=995702 RepID=UPI00338E0E96